MNLKNFYMSVGMVLPVLDGEFSANMDVNRAPNVIGFRIIGMRARLASNCDESVSQEELISARKRLRETQ